MDNWPHLTSRPWPASSVWTLRKGAADHPLAGKGRSVSIEEKGDYVVGQWEGGGTQTGDAFDDMPIGSLPAGTGKTMHFTGTTILKVENGLITEEIGLDDGVKVLQQLGLITAA